MVLSGGMKLVKILFVAFNVLLLVLAIVLLIFSAWATLYEFETWLETGVKLANIKDIEINFGDFTMALSVLFVSCLLLAGFSILGIIAGSCESRCCLAVYFVGILILFVFILGCGIGVLANIKPFKHQTIELMDEIYSAQKHKNQTTGMAIVEKQLECCGLEGKNNTLCVQGQKPTCDSAFWDMIRPRFVVVVCLVILCLLLEVVTVVFAPPLYRSIGKQQEQYETD